MKIEFRLISDDGVLLQGVTWDAFNDFHSVFTPPLLSFGDELWKGRTCLLGWSYQPHLRKLPADLEALAQTTAELNQ